jgi:hypothetical protein
MRPVARYNDMEKPSPSHLTSAARVVRVRTVVAPAQYEGVGNALRSVFSPEKYGLPEDFSRLLAKLG